MEILDIATFAGAVTVPLCAVVGLFYAMMRHELKPIRDDLKELRDDVHSIDVHLANLEGRLAPGGGD